MNLWHNRTWSPMLLKEIDKPFDSKDYLYEIKFDGIRAICYASKKEVVIYSRNKKNITHLFPELQTISKIVKNNVIFDGEIIKTENGLPSFSLIQKRIHLKNSSKINKEASNNPVQFVAFDILYENKNLDNYNLLQRKNYLAKYPDNDIFIKSKVFNKGIALFKEVKKRKLEGIVAKNKNSQYHINKRTDDFIKIKNIQRETFFIAGYTEKPKESVITIAVGEFKDKKLYYSGKVILAKTNKLYLKLKQKTKTKNYFVDKQFPNMVYIKPTLKCSIEYLEKTKSGHLRHASIKEV